MSKTIIKAPQKRKASFYYHRADHLLASGKNSIKELSPYVLIFFLESSEMASKVVQRQLTTPKKVNYARLSRLIIDLLAPVLRDILLFYYPCPEDVQEKIIKTHLENIFRKDMSKILDADGYEKCDISLLYKLIRHTCQIIPPTINNKRKMTWGGNLLPSRECTELSDDIERIRIIRNRVFGHAHSTDVEDGDLEKYFEISLGICQRMAEKFGMRDYVKELNTIRTCRMENDEIVQLTEKVQENINRNEDLFDYVRKVTGKTYNTPISFFLSFPRILKRFAKKLIVTFSKDE